MEEDTQVTNTEDYKTRAMTLVEEVIDTTPPQLAHFTVSDIMDKTGLSRPSVQRVLNELVKLKRLRKTGFKHRVGHVYTPVASEHFRVIINQEVMNTKELLEYIATSESPHRLVAEEQWRNLMKIFMCRVMGSSEEVPYGENDVTHTLIELRNQTIELQKILNVMLNEFSDETSKMLIERDLEEIRRADRNFSPVNYINYVMGSGEVA